MRFLHLTITMPQELYYFAPLVLFVIRIGASLLKCGFYSMNFRFKMLKHEFVIVLHVRHKQGMTFRIMTKYIGLK